MLNKATTNSGTGEPKTGKGYISHGKTANEREFLKEVFLHIISSRKRVLIIIWKALFSDQAPYVISVDSIIERYVGI